jgi:uncharacterized protein YqjF (DUF2071 family)
MSEDEVREFVEELTDRFADVIVARWLADREEAADEARDAIHDDARDGWTGDE